jgi:hypothetical protein
MTCNRVQGALDALADGELDLWTAWRVGRHLDRCPDCAAISAEAVRLGERTRAWRDVAAPEALQRRISAALAGQGISTRHQPAPPRTNVWRAAPLAASGLATVALLVFLLLPGGSRTPRAGTSSARTAADRTGETVSRSLLQEREDGSQVMDDLLYLNPVRLASADATGLNAAVNTLAAEAPGTDERLQQKGVVHASMEQLSDILAGLSRATGVTLLARIEVADEKMSVWAEGRPLVDVMRDLRHLRGYFWSRAKRDGQYVYSIWQDAQSRAQEEAEAQRLAMEQQREFEENIRRHVKALSATDEELKRLAHEDPYLVAQMKHPVVRNGYQLFATLSPDQQAQLTQGQTPSRGKSAGEALELFPLEYQEGDPFEDPPEYVAQWAPLGDTVTLRTGEMTPAQRTAVAAILQGAATMTQREVKADPRRDNEGSRWRIQSASAGSPETATVTFFRWGDPNWQGLSLRVDFESRGRKWGIYSNIGVPPSVEKSYSDELRAGKFQIWPGAQEEVDRYLGRGPKRREKPSSPPEAPPAVDEKPDPILDTPITLTWRLPLRDPHSPIGSGYRFTQAEVLAALHRDVRRPLVLDTLPDLLEPPRGAGPEFHVESRPLRELLHQLFPGREIQTDEGAIFIRSRDRLRDRLNAVPEAIREFLAGRNGAFALDDIAFIARSLSPWQVVKLQEFFVPATIDEMLSAQELLKLYGELGPAQRNALPQGLAFSRLTPGQQALFLAFAGRYRPFVEPWRFQSGLFRLAVQPPPKKSDGLWAGWKPVSRMLFQVRFQDGDTQSFPVDLFPPIQRGAWKAILSSWVGKPFPFPSRADQPHGAIDAGIAWKPALDDPRLRHRASIILLSRPFAEPYAGLQPPPAPDIWARGLAERLRGTGIPVVHVTVGAPEAKRTPGDGRALARQPDASLPHLIELGEPGDLNGEAFDSAGNGWFARKSPTVFVLGADEIVRAVLEGQDAWDLTAIERAARSVLGKRAVADRR